MTEPVGGPRPGGPVCGEGSGSWRSELFVLGVPDSGAHLPSDSSRFFPSGGMESGGRPGWARPCGTSTALLFGLSGFGLSGFGLSGDVVSGDVVSGDVVSGTTSKSAVKTRLPRPRRRRPGPAHPHGGVGGRLDEEWVDFSSLDAIGTSSRSIEAHPDDDETERRSSSRRTYRDSIRRDVDGDVNGDVDRDDVSEFTARVRLVLVPPGGTSSCQEVPHPARRYVVG